MAQLKKLKKLRGRKLKIEGSIDKAARMRMHSNEMQGKINEIVDKVNAILKRV